MTTIDLTPRLRLAADYLAEHGWLKGSMGEPGQAACLTGAIRFCAPQTGDEHIIRQVLAKRDRAEEWNDAAGVGSETVITYLRTAEITDADLADTFGPQWLEIVDLVRKAATLTTDQAHALHATRAAARDAAWSAARAATRAAARDAARAAARAAAGVAARDAAEAAAEAAAEVAAGTLAVRDLIGQHGFTQAHYETLTAPWVSVMGPVHPDDVA